ncbi:MAG: hypothetical protein GXP29_06790 [Planctomycetes bacterium]|nr:hypothetical protein [Planctomycetota bacterium]
MSARNGLAILAASVILATTGCELGGGGTTAPPADDGAVTVAREIEEADIVKLVDGYFYISNPYTGLRIIDATNMAAPVLAGSFILRGRGIELIVRDQYALVLTAADFGFCAGEPVDFDDPVFGDVTAPDYNGTRLWVIDVSDKNEPNLVATVSLEGTVVGTRRVGDILYAAGTIGSTTFVTSMDITDPANIRVVESLRFGGDAEEIHVSQEAIFLFGDDATQADTTRITYVDITSTNGLIEKRDSFRVPGQVGNRFHMDADGDAFRIVTEEFDRDTFTTVVALYTYDVSDPDNVTRLAELPIVTRESLRSVRFDGPRGYVVTFQGVDPLFVLDLTDPADPQVSGELTVPGFSTHLVPMGDRLIGVGFASGAGFEPAVSLYDVSDPSNPRQLSRLVVESLNRISVSSEATVDEKALGVLPDFGIILLPYAVFDRETGSFTDGLQLIQITDTNLRERGRIEHDGIVRRSGISDGRLWLLSDLAFAAVNTIDLDAPASLADLTLVSEQELLDAGLLDCVDSARLTGTPIFFDAGFCGTVAPFPFAFAFVAMYGLRVMRRSRGQR